MRAIVCHELGEPDVLRLEELPDPVPGPGEVAVRMRAAAINFPDVLMVRGGYQFKPEPPFTPGIEGAGEITALGTGVTGWRVGDRVIAGAATGALAELAIVKAAPLTLIAMPAAWSFAEGAAFRVCALTAYHSLMQSARLAEGETVLVHGASGGVGLAAVKLAKHLGARVIATGVNDAKLEIVQAHGAEHAINLTRGDWVRDVKAITGGKGAEVVLDPVGGEVLLRSLSAAATGGRVLVVGFTSGGPTLLPSNHLLIKRLSVIGIRAGEAVRSDPALAADWIAAMPGLMAHDAMRPHISICEPLERTATAMRALLERRVVGKAVVEI